MPQIGRPKTTKTLPKAMHHTVVSELVAATENDGQRRRRSDWLERDRAIILTALLAGLRSEELINANVGDLRRTADGARSRGALVHGLRHKFATELANSEVGVYALVNLPGYESMSTSQRYVSAAGSGNGQAAGQIPLCVMLRNYRAAGSWR